MEWENFHSRNATVQCVFVEQAIFPQERSMLVTHLQVCSSALGSMNQRNRARSQVPAFHSNRLSDTWRKYKKRLRRERLTNDKHMKHTYILSIYVSVYIKDIYNYTNTCHIVLTWNSCTWRRRRSSASSRFRCSQRRSFHSGGIGGGAGCLGRRVI